MKWKVSDLRKNWGIFNLVKDDLLHDIVLFHVFPICDGYMCSSLSAIFVTTSGDTYALGQNRCRMLGIDKNAYPDPVLIEGLRDSLPRFHAIDTGLMHTLALTADGEVYEWGLNVMEPYCHPLATSLPHLCTSLESYTVLQIACGSYFNLALTSENTVMYWGYYDITQKPLQRPISFLNEPSIVSLSSGLLFSAAIGSSGKVYTWTGPRREEWTCNPEMVTYRVTTNVSDVPLGRKTTKKEKPLEPRAVKFPETPHSSPMKVVCTMRSIYILMDSGHVYVTGYVPRAFKLDRDGVPYPPDERSFCDDFLAITCAGYPVDVDGTKWMDRMIARCINPENIFVFADSGRGSFRVQNIVQAFAEGPTPQIKRDDFVNQDFDEPVYVTPRPELNQELFCSESLSDVKFLLADKKVIPAHKYVLLAYSQFFRNMYGGDWKETSTNVIDVSKYNPVAYKAYLSFLYNGTLGKLSVVDLIEVYHLADEHLETALKKLCLRDITKSNVDSSNVAELYDWALCNELKDFAKRCVEYGATHLQDVLKSDGFANMAAKRRELFIKELFSNQKSSKNSIAL